MQILLLSLLLMQWHGGLTTEALELCLH